MPEAAPSTTRYNGISQSPERIKEGHKQKKHSGPKAKGLDSTWFMILSYAWTNKWKRWSRYQPLSLIEIWWTSIKIHNVLQWFGSFSHIGHCNSARDIKLKQLTWICNKWWLGKGTVQKLIWTIAIWEDMCHDGSMGLVVFYLHLVDLYGKLAGKICQSHDPMGVLNFRSCRLGKIAISPHWYRTCTCTVVRNGRI